MMDGKANEPRLVSFRPGIWWVGHDVYMYGWVHFPARMTVVELAPRSLALISPVPIDDTLASEIAALGQVDAIIAPNRMHHLYLGPAIARYTHATVWGAPRLAEKRPDLRIDATLGQSTQGESPPPWSQSLTPLVLEGNPWLSEVAFLHHASSTLIVTDLVFHLHEVSNLFSRWLFRSVGVLGRLAQSRIWRMTTRDRDALRTSLETMLSWPIEAVIMAHGVPLSGPETADRLRSALQWALEPTTPALESRAT